MDDSKLHLKKIELMKNTVKFWEVMGIKAVIKHIECERDLHLKSKPPNQCIYRYQDGRCEPTNGWCIKIYPFDCPFVVKLAHYKNFIRESEE